MKALKYLAIVLAGFFLFVGCQKEYSYESFPTVSAAGTLKNDSGDCMPITVIGNYSVDSSLNDSNYVVVQVNFTKAGGYIIESDSLNGFSFKDSGYAVKTGLQSVTLKGTGRPLVQQITNFSVTFDSTVCTFSVSVGASTRGPAAVFSLVGSANSCSNVNVQGDYNQGTPLTSANVVSIQVNVDSIGTYYINTPATNGMSFVAQGIFLATGVQTVTLQGSGTPTTAGVNNIPLNAGGTSCAFTVTVTSGVLPGEDSAWQFSEGPNFLHGFVDTTTIHRVELPGGDSATALSFYGSAYPGHDSLFQVDVLLPGNTVQTGVYNTDSANADFYVYNTDTTKPSYYQADFTITPPVNVQINITSYDPVTKIVRGTFSGTASNAAGQTVTITAGKIYGKLQ